jgi:hypothetical protein
MGAMGAIGAGTAFAELGRVEVGDRQAGKSPRIEAGPDTVTYTFRIDAREGLLIELVVRCLRTGEIFAALRHAKDPDARS